MQTSIFSVDVEDWFHILDVPSAPALAEWSSLPSRVEKNFSKLMDIFSEEKVHVTCFVLGWIGERFPQLVKEAAARGTRLHRTATDIAWFMSRAARIFTKMFATPACCCKT